MLITFPNDVDPELEAADLLRAMVMRVDTATVFGAETLIWKGGDAYARARMVLARWLTAPGPSLDAVLETSLDDILNPERSGPSVLPDRKVGDIILPATLEDVLRRMGVDPRAWAVAMAFCRAEGEMTIDGVRLVPCSMRSFSDGSYTLTSTIGLGGADHDGREDQIDTESGCLHLGAAANLPETLVALAAGRRIDEIVSHPLLDGLDLYVQRFRDVPGGVGIVYRDRPSRRIADMAPLGQG